MTCQILRFAAFFLAVSGMSPLSAVETGRTAVVQQGAEVVAPQLIAGGEWTSILKLTNQGANPILGGAVRFFDNAGSPMSLTYQLAGGAQAVGSGLTFDLQAREVAEVTISGGQETKYGHAIVSLCGAAVVCNNTALYGEVILRNRNSTRPDFESVFPLEAPAGSQQLFWDHRSGFTSVLYIVNPFASADSATVEIRDTAGQVLRTLTIPMRAGESQILTLHAVAQETIGKQGTMLIRASTGQLVATALRINPSNSFTPVRASVPGLSTAQPTVFSAAGSNAAAIQSTVDDFRLALGTPLNAPGAQGDPKGRREINWDAVPSQFATPNLLPPDFFNRNSVRGVVFSAQSPLWTGFQVSANAADGAVRFANLQSGYSSLFTTFSPEKLFVSVGTNVYDVQFLVPGTSTPGPVNGFGAVFTNVAIPSTSSLEFFTAAGTSLGRYFVRLSPKGLSFVGVTFPAAIVARVRITPGTAVVGSVEDLSRGINIVAVDDFLYGEPQR